MSKKVNEVMDLVANEVTKSVNGKKSSNVDLVENSALSIDNEECETPKKQAVFASVRELFGFAAIDKDELAKQFEDEFKSGKITFSEFIKKVNDSAKVVNKENDAKENISFEDVCNTISNSSLISDFSLFVGTKDLLSLRSRLVTNDNKVILYHGKQSEDSEKFEVVKVTKKGLHKHYKDVTFVSYTDYSTSNLLRAFRCYGYYLASVKRVNRMISNEMKKFELWKQLTNDLHKDFGYMKEDFEKGYNF